MLAIRGVGEAGGNNSSGSKTVRSYLTEKVYSQLKNDYVLHTCTWKDEKLVTVAFF
jgi:hypothetical protein